MVLENLSLLELEATKKKVDDEIKRVYCSRSEEKDRSEKIYRLAEIRGRICEGISKFHSLPLKAIEGIKP